MLADNEAFSSFALPDVEAAKTFYGETLGLDVRDGEEEGTLELHLAGGPVVFVYPKPDHVPATFTVLNFLVDDIDATVDGLSARGVTFEHYDGPPATDEKGIFRGDPGPQIAWFTDPSGNVLSVLRAR